MSGLAEPPLIGAEAGLGRGEGGSERIRERLGEREGGVKTEIINGPYATGRRAKIVHLRRPPPSKSHHKHEF